MRLFVFLLASVFTTHLAAQSTEDALRDRLIRKPLYLRCLCAQDKLRFDATGALVGKPTPISFTLSGVELTSVSLSNGSLTLKGRRVGLEFNQPGAAVRVPLKIKTAFSSHDEAIEMVIKEPASKEYTAALDAVFIDNLNDYATLVPPIWRSYAAKWMHGPAVEKAPPPTPEELTHQPELRKIGGEVSPPRVKLQPEPQYTEEARGVQRSGTVLVYLQVEKDGVPSHIAILKPLGMGLDEQAAGAVSRYRFEPAKQNGQPVRVEMNVEVNFQIF